MEQILISSEIAIFRVKNRKISVSCHKIGGVLQKIVPEDRFTYTLGNLLKISQEMMPMAAPLATPEKMSTGK